MTTPTPRWLAVLLPPVAVYTRRGLGAAFWLNALLTLAFYVPGVVHAWWLRGR